MTVKNNITQKRLKELLHYNPETGAFTWIARRRGVKFGFVAGNLTHTGYIRICINYISYRAHHLAWLYMTGQLPEDQTDHKNHIRNDNRWHNLREATNAINQRNRTRNSNNTSGYPGILQRKTGKWEAYIKANGKQIYLGYFNTKVEAIDARKAAETKHGFHPNHGEKSNIMEGSL